MKPLDQWTEAELQKATELNCSIKNVITKWQKKYEDDAWLDTDMAIESAALEVASLFGHPPKWELKPGKYADVETGPAIEQTDDHWTWEERFAALEQRVKRLEEP